MHNFIKFTLISILYAATFSQTAQAQKISNINDFTSREMAATFDYTSLTKAQVESLSASTRERLFGLVSEIYPGRLVDKEAALDSSYWCHGDPILTEVLVSLSLMKKFTDATSLKEARQHVADYSASIVIRSPKLMDYGQSIEAKELPSLVKKMRTRDQFFISFVGREFKNLMKELNGDQAKIPAWQHYFYAETCNATDKLGLLAVQILDQYGWPDIHTFSPLVSHGLWLVIQHQDAHSDRQRRALSLMKPLLETGGVNAANYAFLYDRVAINSGRPQQYGTQFNNCVLRPVVDMENLNDIRAEVGLGPYEDYIPCFTEEDLLKD